MVLVKTASSVPTTAIHLDDEKMARLKFHITLPSNETVQINLGFKLLTPSKPLPLFKQSIFIGEPRQNINLTAEALTIEKNFSSDSLSVMPLENTTPTESVITSSSTTITRSTTLETITTTTITPSETVSDQQQMNLVTVEEAIESFRQNLIERETEIAGIIETEHPFYRHFRLEYGNSIILPIRCTYEANYKEQLLKISCYEYREFGKNRILSNGEIEKAEALSSVYVPEYIDARNVTQTYSMTIS